MADLRGKLHPSLRPAPGSQHLRFVGDTIRFELSLAQTAAAPLKVCLRTTLGQAREVLQSIIDPVEFGSTPTDEGWHDIEMSPDGGAWRIDVPLNQVGFFKATAHVRDSSGFHHWVEGKNITISVHPAHTRFGNTIYCAFPRLFGATKTTNQPAIAPLDERLADLEERGWTIIPPSGTLRDLRAELPHILGRLKCKWLHLLPINPTPTTPDARMGRYGSPYAALDLTAIDPVLVEFDRRTTGIQQFVELADETHRLGGYLMLDLVINHTGWGSALHENHPEWFRRLDDGVFDSPGAWGTIWEDLVEIDPGPIELWKELAAGFLTWCRRGVDGFRCDAGYKVPLPVWRYITAKVRLEFPDTVFLLEGLGGGWDDTESRLAEGGMQWAYSELFQEFSGSQVAGYFDHALKQSNRIGPLVHYSETHDNDRLAKRGREWSLLRNRLSALASVNGAYGFTSGVEWLAEQKINVHGCAGLNWGANENIVAELAELNELLATHPCFRDGTKLTRLSPDDSLVFALLRESKNGDELLILANLDPEIENEIKLPLSLDWAEAVDQLNKALKGESISLSQRERAGERESASANTRFRLAKAGVQCLQHTEPKPTELPTPAGLLQTINSGVHSDAYPKVIRWAVSNANRVTMVPTGHDLLIEHETPFRAALNDTDPDCDSINRQSQLVSDRHFVLIDGHCRNGTYNMELTFFGDKVSRLSSVIEFPPYEPNVFPGCSDSVLANCRQLPMLLLTNGCGAMSRMSAWLGEVQSKYDCVLAANLHSRLPVDRQVMAKRLRVWVNANSFLSELGRIRLISFGAGERAWWLYEVPAGESRSVRLKITAEMLHGENSIRFCFEANSAKQSEEIEITVRLDVEDRSFHGETKLDAETEKHFRDATSPLDEGVGFAFSPSRDRRLVARATCGRFFAEEEWCRDIPHSVEATRGQEASGDAFSPGWFQLPVELGQATGLTISINEPAAQPLDQEEDPVEGDDAGNEEVRDTGWQRLGQALNSAMNAFVVRRGEAKSIIAGYPWFLDWGRDSLIAVRGLIAAGRLDEARAVVGLFASHEKDGTIPNAIFGDNDSNRETSDAPLWLALAIEELAEKLGKDFYAQKVCEGSRTFLSVVKSIGKSYSVGTPNGILMDAETGLVFSPVHFTWMDTNHPAGTQREGYPVEIQALWIRLLSQLAKLEPSGGWLSRLAKAEQSFVDLFWCDERGWLADCLLAKPGQSAPEATIDANLRCNILIAVSLGVVSDKIARANVDAAARHLVIPGAVRSLASLPALTPHEVRHEGQLLNDPANPYWGRYEGDEDTRRKPAYHNGTAWTWFLPQFCEALVRAWPNDPDAVEAANGYLGSVAGLMNDGCLGQVPELLDGDTPHRQRGCDAQAWGVSEALRVWHLLDELN